MGQTDRDRVRWRARDETRRKRMRVREERPREPADGAHGALMGRMGRTGALNWETAAKQTDLSKIRILSKLSHFKRRRSR